MVAIVNYGVGNLFSLKSSLTFLGIDCIVTEQPGELRAASHIILPGVGAFGDAAHQLRARGLDQVVIEQANAGKPLLGICLGMQLLYERSCEYGNHLGLGLVPGEITALRPALGGEPLKVPHMGWNRLETKKDCPLLDGLGQDRFVYYVHSYFAQVTGHTVASSRYGQAEVTGLVRRGNVYGAQFHPEKSGKVGLEILRAFAHTTD